MLNKIRFKPSFYDLLLIGLMAATATGLKPLFAIISRLIKTSLAIPGGSIIGGLYFIALIMGRELSNYAFTAFFIGLIQAILMTVLGFYGTNGVLSLLSFSLPGLLIDLIYFITKPQKMRVILATIIANAGGLLVVLTVLDKFTLLLTGFYIGISLVGGIICGFLNFFIVKSVITVLKKNNLYNLKH
ncbi:ECF transporter S component [bacterium]|nr:ECF transporter S component [bacterium]